MTTMTTTNTDIETFDNEAFLYIDNQSETIFKKGLICDSDGQLVCIGDIVPIFMDEEFDSYAKDIMYWTPIIRGIKIRIYYYEDADEFNISSVGKIFPDENILLVNKKEIEKQINFELLDKTMCYYAIIERSTGNVILTHIVKNSIETVNISLNDNILIVNEDKAFKFHLYLFPIIKTLTNAVEANAVEANAVEANANALAEANANIEANANAVANAVANANAIETPVFKLRDEERYKREYGILFIRNDGETIICKNTKYDKIHMLEKPEHIRFVDYYVYALNKNPDENEKNFKTYFENELHYDINNEILIYFPEYKKHFDNYKTNLKNYIEFSIFEDSEEKYLSDALSPITNYNDEEAEAQVEAPVEAQVQDDDDYIDIYGLNAKTTINPLYQEEEEEEEILSLDEKRIEFTKKLLEMNIKELIEIINY